MGSALHVLAMAFITAPYGWVFVHPDAVYCLLVVVAATVCLARRAVHPGNGPAWPLALAVGGVRWSV
jgi:acyl-coenzyme A synthetase/AMP-(fatty) acid ligase